MRRPSVIFINRVYPPARGATGRVLKDLAQSFARDGWQVTVVTTGASPGRQKENGVRVIRVKGPEKPRFYLLYVWLWLKLLWAASRLPPAHLLVTMSDPPLFVVAGDILKRIKKSRHIHWCHDLYPDILPVLGIRFPSFLMRFFKFLSRRAMDGCDKVIVIGRCMARTLTLDGLDPRLITVIPNWSDMELLQKTTQRAASGDGSHSLNEKNGKDMFEAGKALYHVNGKIIENRQPDNVKPFEQQIKTGPKFRILYAGNIGRGHSMEAILEAAAILDKDHPEIEFLFVGDGPKFDYLAKERVIRGLDNIRLIPFQPHNRLRQVLESGDVHLITIKEEAAGLMVPSRFYSAIAVHRPTIFMGPAQSETAKVISDFKAGVVVAHDNSQALAQEILRFRMNGEDWFAAQTGAANAQNVFVPKESMCAWIDRAWDVVEPDMQEQNYGT